MLEKCALVDVWKPHHLNHPPRSLEAHWGKSAHPPLRLPEIWLAVPAYLPVIIIAAIWN